MTLTVNADCTSILVESGAFNASNISNTITVSINGGTAVTLIPSSSAFSYTITPDSFAATEFTEGVYAINLTSVLSTSDVFMDNGCAPILCALKCDDETLALYSNTDNLVKVLALEGLKAADGCVACNCDLMLSFYNILTTDESTFTCGCSKS